MTRRALAASIAAWSLVLHAVPASRPAVAATVEAPGDAMVVSVRVNGVAHGDRFVHRGTDGGWWVRRQDLPGLGLEVQALRGREIEGVAHVDLRDIEGLALRIDEASMTLDLQAPPRLLALTVVEGVPAPRARLQEAGRSAFINWALERDTDVAGLRLATEAGWRSGALLFTSNGHTVRASDGSSRFVRLQTRVTYDLPHRLERWSAGDDATRGHELGDGVRLGGLSLSKLYTMDPYLVRYPLGSVQGQASLPSEVEVYVDGQRVRTERVPPGGFELRDLYTPQGARSVEVLVRDPFGRVQRLQDQFCTSDRLLRPGLHEYQYALGGLRRHYGEAGSDYGPAAFAGFHRWGASNAVTLGLRLEGRRGQAAGGPLATLRLGPAGVVSLAFATSRAGQLRGRAGALRYEYQSARGWLGLTLRRDSAGYASLSEPATLSNRRQESHLAMGRRAGPTGTVSLTRSVLSVHAPADMPAPAGFQPAAFDARRATTLTYARTLPGAPGTFRATLSRVQDARGPRTELMLGVTLLLDGPSLLATTASFGDGGPGYGTQWSRNPPLGEGWGHDLSAYRQSLDGPAQGWRAATQLNARDVRLRAQLGADQAQGRATTRGRLTASGAFTWLDGQWRLGRPVEDAWALVKVGDLPGVPVTVNGVPAGVTDSRGQLLVPQVGAWHESAFAIASSQVPIDYALPRLERRVALPDRAGAVVDFEARRLRAVIARLVVQAGGALRPLARAAVRLSSDGQLLDTSTGLQGELYLEDLPAGRYTGQAQAGRLDCRFILELPPHADPVLDAGDLRCEVP